MLCVATIKNTLHSYTIHSPRPLFGSRIIIIFFLNVCLFLQKKDNAANDKQMHLEELNKTKNELKEVRQGTFFFLFRSIQQQQQQQKTSVLFEYLSGLV